MVTVVINIKDKVKVKLTPFGKSILQKQKDEILRVHPNTEVSNELDREDAEGYSEWVLRDLMNQFGEYFNDDELEDDQLPFEGDIIFGMTRYRSRGLHDD